MTQLNLPETFTWRQLDPRFHVRTAAIDKVEVNEGKRYIIGRASTGDVDRYGTIVNQAFLRDAAAKTYTTRGLHYMHDPEAEIGKVEVLDVDLNTNATWIKAWVGEGFDFHYQPSPFAAPVMLSVDNVWKRMSQGLNSGLSLGFMADERPDPEGRAKSILDVTDLPEVSVCCIPGNKDTLSSVMRAMRAWQQFGGEGSRDASVQEAMAAIQRGRTMTDDEAILVAIGRELRAWK